MSGLETPCPSRSLAQKILETGTPIQAEEETDVGPFYTLPCLSTLMKHPTFPVTIFLLPLYSTLPIGL